MRQDENSLSIKELYFLNLILQQAMFGGEADGLYHLMRMISLKVHAVRTSFIRCQEGGVGVVLASNDDEHVKGLQIQLSAYPEIQLVQKSRRPLIIPNVPSSDVMRPVNDRMKKVPYESLAIFPVFNRDGFYGVLSLRIERMDQHDVQYIEKFGQACSQIISLAIGAAAPLSL